MFIYKTQLFQETLRTGSIAFEIGQTSQLDK